MNRLVRGSIMVAAAVATWACSTDLGETPDQTENLIADPSVLFVANDDSQAVEFEALNPEGQQLAAEFEVTDVGAGIVVTRDTAFLPIPGHGNSPTRARFIVRGATTTTFVTTDFTVEANGKSITVPVTITPGSLDISFSNPNPAPGDTVTLTAPANVKFTPETTVDAPGGAQVTALSADSTQISVVFATGNIAATATVTNIVVTYLPGQLFSAPVTSAVTSDSIASFPIGLSALNPNFGDPITLTVPAPFKITPTSVVTIPGAAVAIVSVAADSSSLVFQSGPNANGIVSVDNIQISGAPDLGPFTLTSGANVFTTPVLTSFSPNFSTATPAGGATLTMTAPAGFKFLPTVAVSVGGINSFIQAISADSSVVTFVPQPGTSGVPEVTDLVISTLTGLPLTLPATTSLTVGASQFNNVDDPFGADFLTIPSSGNTSVVFDGGPYFSGTFAANDSRFYRVTLAGSTTFDFELMWDAVDSDMSLYIIDSGFNTIIDAADSFGGQVGGPETGTFTLPAGSYIFAIVTFDAGANVYRMTFDTQ